MAINPQAVRGPVTAVPVVAGKGVRLREDVENNRVVAEVDETVLWSGEVGQITSNGTLALSETPENFESLRFEYRTSAGAKYIQDTVTVASDASDKLLTFSAGIWCVGSQSDFALYLDRFIAIVYVSTPTTLNYYSNGNRQSVNGSTTGNTGSRGITLYKVVGINRVSA